MKVEIKQELKTFPTFNAFVALLPGMPLSVLFEIAG